MSKKINNTHRYCSSKLESQTMWQIFYYYIILQQNRIMHMDPKPIANCYNNYFSKIRIAQISVHVRRSNITNTVSNSLVLQLVDPNELT